MLYYVMIAVFFCYLPSVDLSRSSLMSSIPIIGITNELFHTYALYTL